MLKYLLVGLLLFVTLGLMIRWLLRSPQIRSERRRIEMEAEKYGAESWIAFCYAIFKEEYKHHFSVIVTLNGIDFGAKFIKTSNYRNHMKSRSPSWAVVDLPREKVIQITCDVENI